MMALWYKTHRFHLRCSLVLLLRSSLDYFELEALASSDHLDMGPAERARRSSSIPTCAVKKVRPNLHSVARYEDFQILPRLETQSVPVGFSVTVGFFS